MRLRASSVVEIGELVELISKHKDQLLTIDATVPDELYADVLKTSFWPEAIAKSLIITDEDSKTIRAKSILSSFVSEPVKNKKLLDFGCGDGHCVIEALRLGADAIGFEVKPSNLGCVVSSYAEIDKKAPFDIVILYDVLDHIIDDTTRDAALASIRGWLKPGGRIYVRCHPYTSRHGCHVYEKLNKAYAHLFLTPEELQEYDPLPTVKIVAPVSTYKKWFETSGLKIENMTHIRTELEDFFRPLASQLLQATAANGFIRDFRTLNIILGIQFIDYVLI